MDMAIREAITKLAASAVRKTTNNEKAVGIIMDGINAFTRSQKKNVNELAVRQLAWNAVHIERRKVRDCIRTVAKIPDIDTEERERLSEDCGGILGYRIKDKSLKDMTPEMLQEKVDEFRKTIIGLAKNVHFLSSIIKTMKDGETVEESGISKDTLWSFAFAAFAY